jgi:hypothetical protein
LVGQNKTNLAVKAIPLLWRGGAKRRGGSFYKIILNKPPRLAATPQSTPPQEGNSLIAQFEIKISAVADFYRDKQK